MTDTFLVCLDPASYQIYSIGLSSKMLVIEIDVPLKIRERALKTIRELKELKPADTINWWFKSSQSRLFRKRMVPRYFMHKENHLYPRYFQFFDISQAFVKTSTVDIDIDLTNYSYLKNESTKVACPEKLTISAPLATGYLLSFFVNF